MRLTIALVIVFMAAIWCIDISVTCINVKDCVMTNGWIDASPYLTYHLGIYVAILSFVTLIYWNDYKFAKKNYFLTKVRK